MRTRSFIALGLLTAILVVTTLFSLSGTAVAQNTRNELDLLALSPEARAIALKIQCPVCEGQSIAASNATIAKQMRALVQEKVDAGWTEEQILEFFEERYGPAALREPRFKGVSLGVWVAPPIILLLGLVAAVMIVRQWRRSVPDAQAPLPLDAGDEETVAREMERLRREER